MTQAQAIVEHMLKNDAYSQWLGVKIVRSEAGKVDLSMRVTKVMTQGHGTAHGSITYALSDSALAFSANAHGRVAVSTDTSIKHIKPVFEGDTLTVETEEINLGHRTGNYEMRCYNQNRELVSLFYGSIYRKSEQWEINI